MNEIEALQALRNVHINDTYHGGRLSIVLTKAIEALQEKEQQEKNEPLTLDELKQMDGEPVWIKRMNKWGIIGKKHIGDGKFRYVVGFAHGWEWLEDIYSELIYRHKPKGE